MLAAMYWRVWSISLSLTEKLSSDLEKTKKGNGLYSMPTSEKKWVDVRRSLRCDRRWQKRKGDGIIPWYGNHNKTNWLACLLDSEVRVNFVCGMAKSSDTRWVWCV